MISLPSELENRSFSLYHLEQTLKPLGYVISGGWEYDRGFLTIRLMMRTDTCFADSV